VHLLRDRCDVGIIIGRRLINGARRILHSHAHYLIVAVDLPHHQLGGVASTARLIAVALYLRGRGKSTSCVRCGRSLDDCAQHATSELEQHLRALKLSKHDIVMIGSDTNRSATEIARSAPALYRIIRHFRLHDVANVAPPQQRPSTRTIDHLWCSKHPASSWRVPLSTGAPSPFPPALAALAHRPTPPDALLEIRSDHDGLGATWLGAMLHPWYRRNTLVSASGTRALLTRRLSVSGLTRLVRILDAERGQFDRDRIVSAAHTALRANTRQARAPRPEADWNAQAMRTLAPREQRAEKAPLNVDSAGAALQSKFAPGPTDHALAINVLKYAQYSRLHLEADRDSLSPTPELIRRHLGPDANSALAALRGAATGMSNSGVGIDGVSKQTYQALLGMPATLRMLERQYARAAVVRDAKSRQRAGTTPARKTSSDPAPAGQSQLGLDAPAAAASTQQSTLDALLAIGDDAGTLGALNSTTLAADADHMAPALGTSEQAVPAHTTADDATLSALISIGNDTHQLDLGATTTINASLSTHDGPPATGGDVRPASAADTSSSILAHLALCARAPSPASVTYSATHRAPATTTTAPNTAMASPTPTAPPAASAPLPASPASASSAPPRATSPDSVDSHPPSEACAPNKRRALAVHRTALAEAQRKVASLPLATVAPAVAFALAHYDINPERYTRAASLITLLHKRPGAAHDPSNPNLSDMRSIAVAPVGDRLAERAVVRAITEPLSNELSGIASEQFAFRRDSGGATRPVVGVLARMHLARARSRPFVAASIDLSAAFDRVPRDSLIHLVRALEIERNLRQEVAKHILDGIPLISLHSGTAAAVDYYLGRDGPHPGTLSHYIEHTLSATHAAVIADALSDIFPILRGVPQGAPLSPFLFAIALDPMVCLLHDWAVRLARCDWQDHNFASSAPFACGDGISAYADDIVIFAAPLKRVRMLTEKLCCSLRPMGQEVSASKSFLFGDSVTKTMRMPNGLPNLQHFSATRPTARWLGVPIAVPHGSPREVDLGYGAISEVRARIAFAADNVRSVICPRHSFKLVSFVFAATASLCYILQMAVAKPTQLYSLSKQFQPVISRLVGGPPTETALLAMPKALGGLGIPTLGEIAARRSVQTWLSALGLPEVRASFLLVLASHGAIDARGRFGVRPDPLAPAPAVSSSLGLTIALTCTLICCSLPSLFRPLNGSALWLVP